MHGRLKLPEHSHCKFCVDPVPFKEEYCDDECRRSEVDRVAAKRRRNLISMGPPESSLSP